MHSSATRDNQTQGNKAKSHVHRTPAPSEASKAGLGYQDGKIDVGASMWVCASLSRVCVCASLSPARACVCVHICVCMQVHIYLHVYIWSLQKIYKDYISAGKKKRKKI